LASTASMAVHRRYTSSSTRPPGSTVPIAMSSGLDTAARSPPPTLSAVARVPPFRPGTVTGQL